VYRERPCIADLGEDSGSGGMADDRGKRGGGRGGGELVDLGLGRGEGAVGAIGVVGDSHQGIAFKPDHGDANGSLGRGDDGSNVVIGNEPVADA
jgi:hypothetical protein